jgi:hypothetical protein
MVLTPLGTRIDQRREMLADARRRQRRHRVLQRRSRRRFTLAVRRLTKQLHAIALTTWDFLSQTARREPPPRNAPQFLEGWRGLSVFDTYEAVRALALRLRPPWRRGEYIAVLEIPDDAPFTYKGPDHKGHWMLYNASGGTILERDADLLLSYAVQVVHGPSIAVLPRGL